MRMYCPKRAMTVSSNGRAGVKIVYCSGLRWSSKSWPLFSRRHFGLTTRGVQISKRSVWGPSQFG
jgi:hypothetical protein